MKTTSIISIILLVTVLISQAQSSRPSRCAHMRYWDEKDYAYKWLDPLNYPPHSEANHICSYIHSDPYCYESKYRTYDGSCNNRRYPLWGAINAESERLLPAYYADGVSSFQKSSSGTNLPSARVISKKIFGEKNNTDPEYNIVNMQFGQFVAHDMSYGIEGPSDDDSSCCSAPVGEYKSASLPCAAIDIPKDDPVYPSNFKCMKFTRNVNTGDLGCPKPAPCKAVNQLNEVTSFLDLSLIYGLNEEQAKSLRTLKGGRLITVKRNGYEWPPQDPKAKEHCFVDDDDDICYLGGDTRLNQSPHLTIIHVLYIREHNRIADALAKINPRWKDEKIFQEARRINIAQYQYVTYYEWLPIFLGKDRMKDLGLIYHSSGRNHVNDYSSRVKPTVYNEHTAAAFRYYHSQIEGHLNLLSESREIKQTVALSDVFLKPKFTEDNFDDLARGMTYQPAESADINYDSELREKLLKNKDVFGTDLKAIDIQRGRDHGIARYNDFREYCGLNRLTKWEDFKDVVYSDTLDKLKEVYESPEDVEFAVGSMLEKHVEHTLAGPTLLCIFDKQFITTRRGDRYWFESGDDEVAFRRSQLAEIRKSSLARLICDNGNDIRTMQPEAFKLVEAHKNEIVSCDDIPKPDLEKWRSY